MSSSQVIGDVKELSLQTIKVPATHSGTGNSETGSFSLTSTDELSHYIDNYADVRIVGPIVLEISGPVSSTIATTAIVALFPDKYDDGPTTKAHVASLEGRVSVQHSLLVGSVLNTPASAREVGESLKVRTLLDHPPAVAYHVDIAGGTSSSAWIITVHVPISVSGVSHFKTW
jgi:hypothetical protein